METAKARSGIRCLRLALGFDAIAGDGARFDVAPLAVKMLGCHTARRFIDPLRLAHALPQPARASIG